jgi:hypothetical protein
MDRYAYRRVRGPDDLRPGERLVVIELPNANATFQGNRRLNPEYLQIVMAERAIPFRSHIRTRGRR